MELKHLFPALMVTALGMSLSAQAHDPKEHMKDAEVPNCAPVVNMDLSEIDKDDPVMQAIMKQCRKHLDHADESTHQHQETTCSRSPHSLKVYSSP